MRNIIAGLALAATTTTSTAWAQTTGYTPCTVEDASSPSQTFPCRWNDGTGLAFTVYRASRDRCPVARDDVSGEWSRGLGSVRRTV